MHVVPSLRAAVLLAAQEKLGQGHYNPATTRVLHLAHNPAAEAERAQEQARTAELTGENAALKAHLAELKAAQRGGSGGSGGQSAQDKALVVAGAELAVAQHRVRQRSCVLLRCAWVWSSEAC